MFDRIIDRLVQKSNNKSQSGQTTNAGYHKLFIPLIDDRNDQIKYSKSKQKHNHLHFSSDSIFTDNLSNESHPPFCFNIRNIKFFHSFDSSKKSLNHNTNPPIIHSNTNPKCIPLLSSSSTINQLNLTDGTSSNVSLLLGIEHESIRNDTKSFGSRRRS